MFTGMSIFFIVLEKKSCVAIRSQGIEKFN